MRPTDGLFIGLMSGTSLDGVDAVLARLPPLGTNSFASAMPGASGADRATAGAESRSNSLVLAHAWAAFPTPLHAELLSLQQEGPNELQRAALAANALADLYAQLVQQLLAKAGVTAHEVRAIGAHGQTVRHRPELGYTLQINAPARLAEACGIDVIADFRSRDVAAGGQGAPLVPAFHAGLFRTPDADRVVINIGGMANVTELPADPERRVRGWDTGPGNCLLDGWIGRCKGLAYDADGNWADSGSVDQALLAALSAEPWLALPPPKSTGRDLFNLDWLLRHDAVLAKLPQADVQATLAQFTADTIAAAILEQSPGTRELIVCGGGARNTDLLARLGSSVNADRPQTPRTVSTSDAHGLPADQVEALAFAWLAQCHLAGHFGNLVSVTGARGARVLGARYPK